MRYTPDTNPTRFSRLASLLAGGGAIVALAITAPVMTAPVMAQSTPSAGETVQPEADNGMVPAADLQMQGDFIVAQTPGHVLGTNLIGADVVTADGDVIGPVADIIIDQERELVGITVSVGGFLGIGDREIGIPASAMVVAPDVETTGSIVERGDPFTGPVSDVVITMNSDEIEQAPEFARLEDIPGFENGAPAPASPNGTPIGEPQVD
ncbi:MAG: PRC-barrel domain-containing protein [Salinarimonas sp.]|nr:PRC-barrel domain-containing protein [Salinarimonas sp.]